MTWAEMTEDEQAEVGRLSRRYSEGWIEREAAKTQRQLEFKRFVLEHRIACFKCKSRLNDWASTGTSEFGSKWAICVRCVRGPR